ncbi:hypothetical protein VTH82DRAFT_3509 [Thermothelomyces myriococcoides]
MEVLPEGTSLGSFLVVTAILSVITFSIVFNLQILVAFVRQRILDRTLAGMLRDWDPRWRERAQRLRREGQNKRKTFPPTKWLYVGYIFYRFFSTRKAAKPERRNEEEGHPADSLA